MNPRITEWIINELGVDFELLVPWTQLWVIPVFLNLNNFIVYGLDEEFWEVKSIQLKIAETEKHQIVQFTRWKIIVA